MTLEQTHSNFSEFDTPRLRSKSKASLVVPWYTDPSYARVIVMAARRTKRGVMCRHLPHDQREPEKPHRSDRRTGAVGITKPIPTINDPESTRPSHDSLGLPGLATD